LHPRDARHATACASSRTQTRGGRRLHPWCAHLPSCARRVQRTTATRARRDHVMNENDPRGEGGRAGRGRRGGGRTRGGSGPGRASSHRCTARPAAWGCGAIGLSAGTRARHEWRGMTPDRSVTSPYAPTESAKTMPRILRVDAPPVAAGSGDRARCASRAAAAHDHHA